MDIDETLPDAMRSSIDAALGRARAEWDGREDEAGVVVLTAMFADASVRVRAPARVADARARELVRAGWSVEFRDLSDRPIPWSEADGLGAPPAATTGAEDDPPLVVEEDLPALPDVRIERLRDTA